MRTGARELPAIALVAAAEAFAEGRDKTLPLTDAEHPIVDEIIALASGFLRDTSEKPQNPFLGALSIAALARSAPDLAVYATGLVFHGQDNVRALGARYAPGTPDLFRAMSTDPSPQVRIAVARRAPELPRTSRTSSPATPIWESDGQSRTTVTGTRDDIHLLRNGYPAAAGHAVPDRHTSAGRWLRTTTDVQSEALPPINWPLHPIPALERIFAHFASHIPIAQ